MQESNHPARQMDGFPAKTALALSTALTVLLGAHFYGNRSHGLDPGIVRQAASLKLPHAPTVVAPAPSLVPTLADSTRAAEDPRNGVQQAAEKKRPAPHASLAGSATAPAGGAPGQAAAAAFVDDGGALDSFYALLWALQQHTAPQVVTVLHYGDSPTTADLITGDVRALLQQRFGDAGHGFNLGAKPWAWYGHRDVDMSDKGWASSQKDATPVGRLKPAVYGLGGAGFVGGVGAQPVYTVRDAAQTAVMIEFLGSAGVLTVAANNSVLASIDTNGSGPMTRTVLLPPATRTVKLDVVSGTVKLSGVDFRRGDNGILYDSLGLNGATTTVVSRTFDPVAWSAELQAARPALIILNYGTNESQFGGLVDTLDKELRLAIDKTHAAAPGVPILIMSPMDRGEGNATSGIHTNPLIPKIVAIQQHVAAETHCAFFNTYAAMGGDGTMARWYAARPRLITADLIHPTPQGAEYVAQLFVSGLYAGFDRWKRVHSIGVVAVMDPVQAAAQHRDERRQQKEAAARAKADAREKAAARHPTTGVAVARP